MKLADSCFVITRFGKDQPGFLDFSYRIKSLARQYRLTVVSDAPLTQPELQLERAEYVVLQGGKGRAGLLRYQWNCVRLIRMRRPSRVILLHSAVAPVALLSGPVPTAVYWNEHPTHFTTAPEGLAPVKRTVRSALRWLVFQGARQASLVMPIGEAHLEDLLAHGRDPRRTRLIYMGVDAAFARVALCGKPKNDDSPLELIYVGSVSKARGRDVMLEAVALANRQEIVARLTLVGAGADEREHCKDYARRLGIAEAVCVHGRVPGDEIPEFLKDADAGICIWEDRPWWRFNPPTKLFEYLVAGLPVLASNIRTHTQYVSDWHNGLIFQYDSVSLAEAIGKLRERRAELPALKQRAWESGEQYLWGRIEPEFLEAIEGLAQ